MAQEQIVLPILRVSSVSSIQPMLHTNLHISCQDTRVSSCKPSDLAMKGKVKCTLVQAIRLCTGRTAHRGSSGIALPIHDQTLEGGEGSASRPGRFFPPERLGTHCTGSWVGPRAGLDRCGKSRPPPGFDLRTVQPLASRYTD